MNMVVNDQRAAPVMSEGGGTPGHVARHIEVPNLPSQGSP